MILISQSFYFRYFTCVFLESVLFLSSIFSFSNKCPSNISLILNRCKGFLIQKAPINERTCKHLKEYLGDQFEKARVEKNTKPKKAHISSHINVNLLLAHKYDEK